MKNKIFFHSLIWLLTLPFIFISCGDDNEEPDNEPAGWNQAILGKWKLDVNENLYEIQSGNQSSINLQSIVLDFIDESNVTVWMRIASNTAGGGGGSSVPIYYKYSMSGDGIRFTNIKTNEESEMKYDISGAQLYLTYKGGSMFPTYNYTDNDGKQHAYTGPTSAIYTRVE